MKRIRRLRRIRAAAGALVRVVAVQLPVPIQPTLFVMKNVSILRRILPIVGHVMFRVDLEERVRAVNAIAARVL